MYDIYRICFENVIICLKIFLFCIIVIVYKLWNRGIWFNGDNFLDFFSFLLLDFEAIICFILFVVFVMLEY